MPHEFYVDRGASRLDVRTWGTLSADEEKDLVEGVTRQCRAHSLARVLVDLNYVAVEPDDLALYRIGRIWADFARGRVRTAFVMGNFPELDRFVGEVMREKGAAWGLLKTKAEAEAWLEAPSPTGAADERAAASGAG
jgi:hypothetical protein